MANTAFSTMANSIGPIANGCPTPTIVAAVRETLIDLCHRGQVWKYEHPDVSVTTPTYTYAFVPPSGAVVSIVEIARINNDPINVVTLKEAISAYPTHPDTTNLGQPITLWQVDQRNFILTPVPDASYTLKLNTTLKPTTNATEADSTLIAEHYDTIVHGALHRLLLQQGREWHNEKLGGYYGRQYAYKLGMAKASAVKGFGQISVSVAPIPFA